nr:60S ribosomal protein L27 [Ipomoea batatas]
MVKFLKPNKAVILLQGRYAGRKAVIVRCFDDGTRDRPYGHCLVAGIAKYPKKVIRKDSAKKQAKKSRVRTFVKVVNYNHIMPTRYTLDVDLKDAVTQDCLQSHDKRVAAAKEAKARFEERFKTGKNRWFFSKLRLCFALRLIISKCRCDGIEVLFIIALFRGFLHSIFTIGNVVLDSFVSAFEIAT